MGAIVRKTKSNIPCDDEFEVQRCKYVTKEKEFDSAVLNFFHNKKKIQKQRMNRYMTNEDDIDILIKELREELNELNNILEKQKKQEIQYEIEKVKLYEKHKKDFDNKIKIAHDYKDKQKNNKKES
jgi:hypothetical protein